MAINVQVVDHTVSRTNALGLAPPDLHSTELAALHSLRSAFGMAAARRLDAASCCCHCRMPLFVRLGSKPSSDLLPWVCRFAPDTSDWGMPQVGILSLTNRLSGYDRQSILLTYCLGGPNTLKPNGPGHLTEDPTGLRDLVASFAKLVHLRLR